MYALRFKFQDAEENCPDEAFLSLLSDLVIAQKMGFPVLRTQIYYPDSSDLGIKPPNEFMIEVLSEDGVQALEQFLQSRSDVQQSSILAWDPIEAMSPEQPGMWCYTYHAGVLRRAPADDTTPPPSS